MIFTFLGTGCPVPSPLRAGPGHLVRAGSARLLIDCGSGVAQRLVAAGERGAALLVCEVFVAREMVPTQGVRSAETVAAVRSYHMAPGEIAALAKEAEVEALALTHFVPPQAERASLLAEIRETYRGPVILGEDLMSIDVAARMVTLPGLCLGY